MKVTATVNSNTKQNSSNEPEDVWYNEIKESGFLTSKDDVESFIGMLEDKKMRKALVKNLDRYMDKMKDKGPRTRGRSKKKNPNSMR